MEEQIAAHLSGSPMTVQAGSRAGNKVKVPLMILATTAQRGVERKAGAATL